MLTPTVARAEQLAAQLLGAGIPATHDVRQLAGMAPAVLVPPPSLAFDHATPTATWQLVIVASVAEPLTAWAQIDELLALVVDELPIEAARPVAFAVDDSTPTLPGYVLTLTD